MESSEVSDQKLDDSAKDPNTGKTLQLPKTVTTCFLASKNLVKSVIKNLA